MTKLKGIKTVILSLLLALFFFIFAFYTFHDYGISWDETIHFARGQAYLYYFLTGKTNYKDLLDIDLQGTFGKPENYPAPRRSFYQLNDYHDGDYFIRKDVGHPPVNDILAATSNYIFFQKLGVLDDITSYHFFNILASSVLVFVVAAFGIEVLGTVPGIISALILTLYPLFWAESHFNIKDPVEAAFFTGAIWSFWKSLQKSNWLWLIISSIFFGLALGTKFNALFIPVIVAPYLLIRYRNFLLKPLSLLGAIPKAYLISLLFGPFIVAAIFFGTWPYLWQNFPENFLNIFRYYKEIGIGTSFQPDSFYLAGFNTFPLQWMIFTTPPITLVLTLIGIVSAWLYRKKHGGVLILWLLWLSVPILRVTLPGTVIYGGIRQIMEYLPAMALLAGLGTKVIYDFIKPGWIKLCLTFLIFTLLTYPIIKYHPNENVYFNFLIGGLKGAEERNFPSWGNSFGNAYLQGIKWINENAPEGAKLSLIQGTRLNVPPILVRKDIDFSPLNWSGIERGGEYLMELTFNDTAREFNYAWEYVDKFLVPVYEVKVDGVAILKVWKNDVEHTRNELKQPEKDYLSYGRIQKSDNLLTVRFDEDIVLSRINLSYSSLSGCTPVKMSFLEISEDGKTWQREKDAIPYPQIGMKLNSQDGMINYYLAHKKARAVRFVLDDADSCALFNPQLNFKVF